MSAIKILTDKVLLKRLNKVNKDAKYDALLAGTEVVVFHMSESAIARQMLTNDTAHMALAVSLAFLDYFKTHGGVISSNKGLSARLDLTGTSTRRRAQLTAPFVYHKRGSADFVVIARNNKELAKLINPANTYVAKKLGLEGVLTTSSGGRSFQLGASNSTSGRGAGTPGLRYLQKAKKELLKFTGGTSLLNEVSSTIRKLEQEYADTGEYELGYKGSSSVSKIAGMFVCTYIAPRGAELNAKLRNLDKQAAKDISKKLLEIKGPQGISAQLSEIIRAALWGQTYSDKTSIKDTGRISGLSKKNKKALVRKTRANLKKLPVKSIGVDFQSLITIINSSIEAQISTDMERPYLEYQTGRFAKSVEVKNITEGRSGALAIYYDYMKYPYQTFEPGHRLGHLGYGPRLLISKSIRSIAQEHVTQRFRSISL